MDIERAIAANTINKFLRRVATFVSGLLAAGATVELGEFWVIK